MKKDFHCPHAPKAFEHMPDEIVALDVADFFKILGDYTRIRLLSAMRDGELCVHDLSLIVGMQQSAVSHQLKTLRHYKLVKVQRRGRQSFYSLNDDHVLSILEIGFEHILHSAEKERIED